MIMPASISLSITGENARLSAFDVAVGQALKINFPEKFGPDLLAIARKDLEIFAKVMDDSPDDVLEMIDHASHHDVAEVMNLVKKLDLSEERFIKDGGGWVAIAIIVIILILAVSSDTPPTPSDGGSDAGAG
jgi:hypothetical protein